MKLFCRQDHRSNEEEPEPVKAVAERRQRVQGIFDDLLNLEVNVIVTPGMTARKMPAPYEAFSDIAKGYAELLADFSKDVGIGLEGNGGWRIKIPTPRSGWGDVGELSMVDAEGNLQVADVRELTRPLAAPTTALFRRLAARAVQAWTVGCALVATLDAPEREEVNAKVVLLKRIFGNCEQLVKIIDPVGTDEDVPVPMDLESNQLITLRKIWEVGIATVVMQTVVQLDGDIVTRIHKGHESASSSTLHQLHREAVASAVQNWQFLGRTLADFLQSALKRFL